MLTTFIGLLILEISLTSSTVDILSSQECPHQSDPADPRAFVKSTAKSTSRLCKEIRPDSGFPASSASRWPSALKHTSSTTQDDLISWGIFTQAGTAVRNVHREKLCRVVDERLHVKRARELWTSSAPQPGLFPQTSPSPRTYALMLSGMSYYGFQRREWRGVLSACRRWAARCLI